jgi:apolipoprotein N-acyltransferase
LAELILGPWSAVRGPGLRRQTAIVGVVLVLAIGYGFWRLGHAPFRPGPNVALLQTDLEQAIRNSRGDEPGAQPRSIQDIRAQTAELTRRAVKSTPPPDLIIWPETTFEYDIKERRAPPANDPEFEAWAQDLPDREALVESVATASRTSVLLGVNVQRYHAPGRVDRFNSSVLVAPTGQILGRYDKTHLVPFGEYVPLYDLFPFLRHLAPYDDALALLAAGDQFPRLRLTTDRGEFTFGCMICYEDSYAHLARKYLRGPDRPADFLVNQSNDGWFRCTHEHEEHLAVSRFRAVECRRSLVRSANMGISAIIDGDGRIVALPAGTWATSKGLMAVVTGAVPIDDRISVYARTGDLLPWLCWLVLIVAVVRPPRDAAP